MAIKTLKEKAYQFCVEFISNRQERIASQIQEIQKALQSETKSSAGDKHETGRAMIQLEREKLGQQLSETEKIQQILAKVDTQKTFKIVGLGSLVKTTKANYFIAISAGEFKSKNESVFCISAATPIGKLLLGKKVGDTFSFNNSEISIVEIY